jgi:hypothetical protein
MKRREFGAMTTASIVGYNAARMYDKKTSYNHPPIVHDYEKDPVTALPVKDGIEINNLPEYTEDVVVTANKFNDPAEVYKRYEIEPRNGFHRLDFPENRERFVLTFYSPDENYLGESNPLRFKGSRLEEDRDKIPHPSSENYPIKRSAERGHFDITISSTDVSFPVSYQKYHISGRIVGYGDAQEYAKDSAFLRETGKRIIEQSDAESQMEKIELLTRPIQKMDWESDVSSVGKYEYIREPAKTFVDMIGDCKDRTVINNGFLENVLGIETCQVFVPNHMFTGASSDQLNDNTMNSISEDNDIHLVEGMERSYLPIDSTRQNDFGEKYPRTVYAIYTDHYQLLDLSGFIQHIISSIPKLLGQEPAYR